MNAGRKPMVQPAFDDETAGLDQPTVDGALVLARADARSEQQQVINDVLALGSDIGIITMARITKGVSAMAEVKAFERFNKSKAFKHIEVPGEDGVLRLAENIDEFCRAVFGGRGYKAMSNQKEMLDKLGEETYDAAKRLDLNRAQLRLLINLPEDTRSVVEEAMQNNNKAEVVTLIQSLANQLDEAKEKTEELKAEVSAREGLLATRAKNIDDLEARLARMKKAPPDEVRLELQKNATSQFNDAMGALKGTFNDSIRVLVEHSLATDTPADTAFMSGLVGELQMALTTLRDTYGIPDIAPAMRPDWTTDPAFKDYAAE